MSDEHNHGDYEPSSDHEDVATASTENPPPPASTDSGSTPSAAETQDELEPAPFKSGQRVLIVSHELKKLVQHLGHDGEDVDLFGLKATVESSWKYDELSGTPPDDELHYTLVVDKHKKTSDGYPIMFSFTREQLQAIDESDDETGEFPSVPVVVVPHAVQIEEPVIEKCPCGFPSTRIQHVCAVPAPKIAPAEPPPDVVVTPCACGYVSATIPHVCTTPLARAVTACDCGFRDKDQPHVCAVPDPVVVHLAEVRKQRNALPPPATKNRPEHMCDNCPSERQLCRPCFLKLNLAPALYEKLYGGHLTGDEEKVTEG